MTQISNGESGSSVRGKLNALFPNSIGSITQEVTFDTNKIMGVDDKDVQTGNYSFTLASSGNVAGYVVQFYIQSNGTNTFTFSSDFIIMNNSITSGGTLTNNTTYLFSLIFDGDKALVNVVETSDVPADVTSPTLSSATIEDSSDNTVDLVFDESVTITTTGWSISTDGAALSISSVSGSGTTTPSFTLSRSVLASETVTLSYDSSTGNTVDGSGNELADITDDAVVNNVGTIIVMEDDFSGTVIDTAKWTETDPDGVISQNGDLRFSYTSGSGVSSRTDYLTGDTALGSVSAIQATLSGAIATAGSGTIWFGMWDDSDSLGDEFLILGGSTNNDARILLKINGSNVYDFSSTVDYNNTWKLLKDGNEWSAYYLSAPNTWTQVGATQTIAQTSPNVYPAFSASFSSGTTKVLTADNFYQTNADYATSAPS